MVRSFVFCFAFMAALGGMPSAASADAVTTATATATTPAHWFAGTFLEYNATLHPGIALSFSHDGLLNGQPRFGLTYATTRLAPAFGSLALNEDRVRLLASWIFRPQHLVQPMLGLGLGYTRFDREDGGFKLLDNDAFGALVQTGLELDVYAGLRVYGSLGYELVSSSTVYPVALGFGLHYQLSQVLPW